MKCEYCHVYNAQKDGLCIKCKSIGIAMRQSDAVRAGIVERFIREVYAALRQHAVDTEAQDAANDDGAR